MSKNKNRQGQPASTAPVTDAAPAEATPEDEADAAEDTLAEPEQDADEPKDAGVPHGLAALQEQVAQLSFDLTETVVELAKVGNALADLQREFAEAKTSWESSDASALDSRITKLEQATPGAVALGREQVQAVLDAHPYAWFRVLSDWRSAERSCAAGQLLRGDHVPRLADWVGIGLKLSLVREN